MQRAWGCRCCSVMVECCRAILRRADVSLVRFSPARAVPADGGLRAEEICTHLNRRIDQVALLWSLLPSYEVDCRRKALARLAGAMRRLQTSESTAATASLAKSWGTATFPGLIAWVAKDLSKAPPCQPAALRGRGQGQSARLLRMREDVLVLEACDIEPSVQTKGD